LEITSIILAGGKSQRFGKDKTSEVIGGESFLERVIQQVSRVSADVIISTAANQLLPIFNTSANIIQAVDVYPDKCSLGGIYSGLQKSRSQYNLVVAADMPFLNIDLIRYLIKQTNSEYDIIVPRVQNRPEPLHSIYSKNCVEAIQELFDHDILRVTAILDKVKVRWVEEEEINTFDFAHRSFMNINTQEDMKNAKLLLAQDL